MNRHITYITGGERSGKSSFAQDRALSLSDKPVYLATAVIKDSDFAQRVEKHKSDRDNRWQTIEEPMYISNQVLNNRVIVLDCITLWLTNIFYKQDKNIEYSLEFAKAEFNNFVNQSFNLFVVSNELGMGVHGATKEIRDFTQLQGWMNQYIAAIADDAFLLVSGLPVKIK